MAGTGTDDLSVTDVPGYILGVTHKIWEERKVSSLDRHYAPDILVRSPAGIARGNQRIIAATMATMAEFPDRELFGEDVIWTDVGDGTGFSSHRLMCTATHLGPGAYGAPTGARLRYRILADCHVTGDQIDDEWLVRDQGAIVRQLGWTPRGYAIHLIQSEGGPARCVQPYHPGIDQAGPYCGTGNDDPWGAELAEVLHRIMRADLAVIPERYDRAAELNYAGGVTAHSFAGADRFWASLRSAFPNAAFEILHQVGGAEPRLSPRAAVRWALSGTHDGWGAFGEPSGAPVYVMGITHVEFGPRGVRREWTLIDEVAVWKQIVLATG